MYDKSCITFFYSRFISDRWTVMKTLREKFLVWRHINGLSTDMVVWPIVLRKFLSFLDFATFPNPSVLSKPPPPLSDHEYTVVIGIYKCIQPLHWLAFQPLHIITCVNFFVINSFGVTGLEFLKWKKNSKEKKIERLSPT